jgi:division protein CdvB (Snf7/Vps24/ESCRT-III family)
MENANVNQTMDTVKENVLQALKAIEASEILIKFSEAAGNDVAELRQKLNSQKLSVERYRLALREQGIII